jgi:hypothetical protein
LLPLSLPLLLLLAAGLEGGVGVQKYVGVC